MMIRSFDDSIEPSNHRIIESSDLPLPSLPSAAIAVSGGADSMALALLAHGWAEEHGIPLHTLTVDHGLRAGSAAEAAQVAEWMQRLNLPHTILRWDEKPRANIQEKAREARHRLMRGWCKAHGIRHLLIAHHADDQAETLLLRLQRGSHVRGLSGMRPQVEMGGITLLRPLLAFPKSRLIATLQARGQAWLEDPSNHSPAYARSRLRGLLAALPEAEAILAQLAAASAQLAAYDEKEAAQAEAFLAGAQSGDGFTFAASAWLDQPADLRHRCLSDMLTRIAGSPHPPRFADLERLGNALAHLPCKRTLHGSIVTRHNNKVRIYPEFPSSA